MPAEHFLHSAHRATRTKVSPVEFLPRTLLFYILSHAYLFLHFHKLFGKRTAFLATLPLFAAMGLFPYVYHMLPPGPFQATFARAGALWLPPAFFCLCVFVLADALSLLALAMRKRFPEALLLFFSRKRYIALLLVLAASLYAYGVYEAHSLRVTPLELATTKLPDNIDHVRVVFAADLHIGPQTGVAMLRETVTLIQSQNPDLILLGGDLLDDSFQGTPADIQELQRLQAPMGVFAVLGNHDCFGNYQNALVTLSKTGITMLSDEAVNVGPLRLAGLDDPLVTAQKGESARDAADILIESGLDRFTILLDHRPGIREHTIGLFDIQLSGHSHGGQLIMLRSLVEAAYGTPTGFSKHMTRKGQSHLFVTTGTGFSKLPIRLFVPPEIVVIDIVRAPDDGLPRE